MKYNINNNNIHKILLNIKKELKESKDIIIKLLEIDYKYCNMKITLEHLESVIDMLKNENLDIKEEGTILIKYSGNPYITLNLSILAILTKTTIILDFKQCMQGINNFIKDTVNNVLANFRTDRLIYFNGENEQNIDKIICIDDICVYNSYLRKNNKKVKFYALNYLEFYSDSDEFEDLRTLIYQHAENNKIPIESFSELNEKEAANLIQKGLGNAVLILTNSEETKETFKSKINNKKIYINQNPFKETIKLLDKSMITI